MMDGWWDDGNHGGGEDHMDAHKSLFQLMR